MPSANNKQTNLHMISKQMIAGTAVKQTSSCADSSPKSSLEWSGGTLLDTTSNVVPWEKGDDVTPATTDDVETVELKWDEGVELKYTLEITDIP